MTNKKITDLVELTTPTTDDVFPLVDIATNSTKKAQLANLPISTATQTALDAKQATLVSGTNIKTINSTSLLGSGDISVAANPAGTAGQIQFSDGSAFAADSNLYWDNTNKRLGVGETTPTARVHIKGAGNTSSSTALFVQNSAANDLFKITDDGFTYFSKANWYTYTAGPTLLRSTTNAGFRFYTGGDAMEIQSNGVGIGTNSPTARLQVKGSGSTSATTSLLVQNSSGAELLKVRDDGAIVVNQTTMGYSNGSRKIFWNYTGGGVTNGMQVLGYGGVALNSYDGSAYTDAFTLTGDGNQRIGIGTTSPNTSAKLDITSTTQGFLPPRMTTTQKNAIASPASGLMVYDTTTNKLCCYNGTTWNDLF